jgi:DMSO reductase anchor subunit
LDYTFWQGCSFVVGLVCAWMFATRPSPKLAYILTLVFMVGTCLLMCLAMILGTLYLGSPQRREGRIEKFSF